MTRSVGLAGCRQSRLPGIDDGDGPPSNVPSIFIYGGSILPGSVRGQTVTVQDLFEAVGKHSVGDMSDEDLDELEQVACPSGRLLRRPVHREHHGDSVRGRSASRCPIRNPGGPRPLRDPRPLLHDGRRAGDGPRPQEHPPARTSVTARKALENAAVVVAASGGSTNAGLHLPQRPQLRDRLHLAHVAEVSAPLTERVKSQRKYVRRPSIGSWRNPPPHEEDSSKPRLNCNGDCMTRPPAPTLGEPREVPCTRRERNLTPKPPINPTAASGG